MFAQNLSKIKRGNMSWLAEIKIDQRKLKQILKFIRNKNMFNPFQI